MKRLLYGVTTAQGADTTSATNALVVRNSAGNVLLGITNDGAVRVGTNSSATTQTTASINASGSGTNIGLALVPKGTGAITAQIPDGGVSGGNARGSNAVDLQMNRINANQVASGQASIILAGHANRATGQYSIAGGYSSLASGGMSIAIGGWPISGTHTASGDYSTCIGGFSSAASASSSTVIGGNSNTSSGIAAIVTGGQNGVAYLSCQRAISSGRFAGNGDAQTSDCRTRRAITGTSIQELTIDGVAPAAGNRLILNLPTGATAGRVWNAKIQLIAVCTVQGAGTVTAGEVFGGNYAAIIKRIGSSTSIVGAGVISAGESYDTNMESSIVTISADDTNESLKIEFTPPTTAAADTVIRVVATVYLTEVGY